MATYVWTGRSRTGEEAKGEIEAESEAEVINKLRAQNIQPSKVKKKAGELKLPFTIGGGVTNKELVIFTRQFATMIDAGLPLVQCLDILANGEPNKSFQRVIYAVKSEVEQGSTFASALNRHPRIFDELYVNLVAAGEVGGILDSILNRLAIYIEKSVKTARKIKSAFTYPTAILCVAILVVIILLWKVIPTFEAMFISMGNSNLPKPTQVVIDASRWFGRNWYFVIGGIILAIVAFRSFYNSTWGRQKFDAFILKLPLFGMLVKKAAVAKFTRTLGTLVAAGVPILDGLEIVSRTSGNRVIERAIMRVRDKISEGRTMAEPLAEANIFPSMVVQMIGVGEATGAMDTMLNKIADFYEEEVDVAVDGLTALLEPLMMVFIGGIVGGILIAMYLPIFSVADNVGTNYAVGVTEQDHQAVSELAGLREKLEWLMLFRLVLVTFLLGSAVVVNVNDVEEFSDPSYVAIVSFIVGTYVATLVYAWWLGRSRSLRGLAYAQLVGDSILAAGLVLLTGGIDSIFTFLFFLTIFNGAVLLGRSGAMFAASTSSLGLAAIVVLQFGDFAFVWDLMPETSRRPARVPVYALIIHLVGFFTVAALSGYLAEKLGQVGSELERRQLDIRELRALNENIVRSLASGLITLDLSGRTIFFNAAAEEITGFTFAEVNMRRIVDIVPELADVVSAAPAVADLHPRPRFEQNIIRPDGKEVYLGISVSPLRNHEGTLTGHIMIFQDVTELKTMRAAILRQEHLSAIGKLSAAIAHEIRNPLASISGSIQMLGTSVDASDDERALMGIVTREVDRLNLLIEDFLAYARPGQTRKRPVDTNELISDTVQIFARDAAMTEKVDIVVEPPSSDVPEVYADAAQIQQVLWNLMRNACEAMPDGGTITLRRSVHHDLRSGRDVVALSVDDTGPGLPDDVFPNLFEPFFTTKETGTGLGLATCHRIVVSHKGQLTASNLAAGGARFTLSLPVEARTAPSLVDEVSSARADEASVEVFTELVDPAQVARLGSRSGRVVPR